MRQTDGAPFTPRQTLRYSESGAATFATGVRGFVSRFFVLVHATRLLSAFAASFGGFFPVIGKVAWVAALLVPLRAGAFFVVSPDLSPHRTEGRTAYAVQELRTCMAEGIRFISRRPDGWQQMTAGVCLGG